MKLSCITNDILNSFVSAECKKEKSSREKLFPQDDTQHIFFVVSVLNEMHISHDGKPLLPEKKRSPVQILTAEEVYAAVKGTPIELPCLLAMWLTLSISEIRGLTKSKSLRGNQLSIVETVIDVGVEPVRKPGGRKTSKMMDTVYTHVFDAARRQADTAIDKKFNSLIKKANEKANKK